MLVIQGGAALAKNLFPLVGASGTTSLRLMFSSFILLFIFRPWQRKISRSQLLGLVYYGFFLGGMNYLFYLSIARIPLGIAVALEFTGPLAVALFSSKRMIDFLWITFVIIGLICLLPIAKLSAPLDLTGIILALAAGACWAGYILTGQKAAQSVPSGTAVSIGATTAALLFAPIGFIQHGSQLFTLEILPLGIAVAILSSALPYSLEMIALKGLSRSTFSLFMSLEPVVAVLSGFLFLNERLTGLQLFAIMLIIIASAGTVITARQRTE